MTAQQENLMEELANRDFIFTEEAGSVIVYEKETREGSETVTIFTAENSALHERWNKNGLMVSNARYDTERSVETMRLLASCH